MKAALQMILLFLLLGSSSILLGQSIYTIKGKNLHELRQSPSAIKILNTSLLLLGTLEKKVDLPPLSVNHISSPKAYSYEHLGVFCKLEVQLEKKTRFPVKFRLGDVQYNDVLEGKTSELMLIR